MKKHILLVTVILFTVYSTAINYNQQFRLKSYSVNEGLSQFTTGKVIQDRFGFIWISTYDGLSRYDGDDFVKYRHDPYNKNSISGNRILAINFDTSDNLWIVTENGSVDKYNYTSDQFEHFLFKPLQTSIVTEFFTDSKGYFWFGTTNGIYKAELKNDEFVVVAVYFNSVSPKYENYILSIAETPDNNLLVGTANGCKFLAHQRENFYLPGQLLTNYTNSLFRRSESETWICTNNGVFIVKSDAIQKNGLVNLSEVRKIETLNDHFIRSVVPIDNDHYLVSTLNRLFVLNLPTLSKTEITVDKTGFFENNIINSTIIDRTQTLWIGSQQKGVAKIDLHQLPNQISRYEQTRGMFVKMLFRDSKGGVWIGANFNGLYYLDEQSGQLESVSMPGTIPSYMLFSPTMIEDNEGNLWLSVNQTLYKYNFKTKQFEQLSIEGMNLQAPFSLAMDSYNSLWIGCTNGLIRYYFDKIKPEFISIGNLSDMVSSEQISRIVFDKKHNIIWACTKDNGIVALFLNKKGKVISKKTLKHNNDIHSLNSNHVWSLTVGSDGAIYIGTDSGLNKCVVSGTDISVTPLKDLQLIAANKIMSIVEDRSKNLWLGTSQALFSYNINNKKEKKFTINNGMFSNATLEASFEYNGYIYVGTINGLNVINTNPQPHNPFKADAIITDIFVSGKSVKSDPVLSQKLKKPLFETDKIVLNYNENSLSIKFMSLHYNDFDENNYEFKLEGYDKDFNTTDSKNRIAHYSKLPSGTYDFWVRASNNENTWGGKEKKLTITVRPAPWLSPWAFIAYFCLGLIIFYFIIKYIKKEAKFQQQLKIKDIERQHQEEISNMKLRFHTNVAHDIRTPLTLIAGPIEDIKNNRQMMSDPFLSDRIGIVDKNVTRLLYLVNQFLDFRRLINQGSTLHNEVHSVATILYDIKKSFDGIAVTKKIHFDFVVEVNDRKLIFDIDKFSKILYNLISNAFKYTPDGGDVFVFIEQQNETLTFRVQDSGCGISSEDLPHIFDRFYQSIESSASSGTGIGLALVKQLVEICKGIIEVQSTPGEGTVFKVILPCEVPADSSLEDPNDDIIQGEINEEEFVENKKATVLVVEDDEDLRSYLVKSFKDKFTVFQAANGQEAFDKALRFTPDIILTDVMMPQVDGIGLIRLVRNDHRTSHIPIIVLTAKTGESEEIKALEAGAEDFIPKPFSTKSLLLKVNNYIRSLSGKRPVESVEIHSKIADREQAFLNAMNKVILDNLENPIFSIDFICEKLAISRMQLHRKMVSLLGKSTSEYIREIKCDEAKKCFEKGERDIESVMLKIGVNSSFHFNKNFKARFGMSVQEYLKTLSKP